MSGYITPEDRGAVGDGITITGTVASGNAVVTGVAASGAITAGMRIGGKHIQLGTTIIGYTATTITLSQPASGSGAVTLMAGTENFAAFNQIASDINSGAVKWVRHSYGKTYLVYIDPPANGAKLCNLTAGSKGLRWEFNRSPINVPYDSAGIHNHVFFLNGVRDVAIEGACGLSLHGRDNNAGASWCYVQGGSEVVRFVDADLDGGLFGFTVARVPGAGAVSRDCRFTGKMSRIYYPFQTQDDLIGGRIDYDAIECGRPLAIKSGKDIVVRTRLRDCISGSGIGHNAFVGDVFDGKGVRDLDLTIIDDSTQSFSPLDISHGVSDPNNPNRPSFFRNIRIRLDIDWSGGSPPAGQHVLGTLAYKTAAGAAGDCAGNRQDNIVVSGIVRGAAAAPMFRINAAAQGFGANTVANWDVRNLQVPDWTQNPVIGAYTDLLGTDVHALGMTTWAKEAAGPGTLQLVHSFF